jgi:DNA-directed RNA polymerase II subunit RPB2
MDEWDVIAAMFAPSPATFLARHQLDSFDDFVLHKIEAIMSGFNPLDLHYNWLPDRREYEVKVHLELFNVRVGRPTAVERDGTTHLLTPAEARNRAFSYSGPLLVDVRVNTQTLSGQDGAEDMYASAEKVLQGVALGNIPIMVGSSLCVWRDAAVRCCAGECRSDPGGYFIIDGTERAVVSQDRMAENRAFVFATNKTASYSHAVEVRSLVSRDFGVPKITTLRIAAKPNPSGRAIHITMHHVQVPLPLFVMLRVLGMTDDMAIFDAIAGTRAHSDAVRQELGGCAFECAALGIYTREHAVQYVLANTVLTGVPREYCADPEFRRASLERMLETELLPHVGVDPVAKRAYLADGARTLILVASGLQAPDDRDSYICKRVDAPGAMLSNIFRQYFGKLVKEVRKNVQKELAGNAWRASGTAIDVVNASNVFKIIRGSTIENGLRYSLATGNWGVKAGAKVGVSQLLNRMTYCATLSHLRRVATSIEKNSKLVQPRKLHGTQWGIFCPAETPEGQSVGVVKNMAVGARVTVACDPRGVLAVLERHVSGGPEAPAPPRGARVKVNYVPVGAIDSPEAVLGKLRDARRAGVISPQTSIVWDVCAEELRVGTDGGRIVRPLFPLDPVTGARSRAAPAGATWVQLLIAGDVQYLDSEEAAHSLIAMTADEVVPGRHGYLEVHPSLALGVLASCIPFPDHNQSPRNSYQSAMGKQAIGIYSRTFRDRMDTTSHVLNYGQRPLVTSRVADLLGCSDMPSGINVVVAISTLGGHNQEDAVVLNKTSVERGLFSSTCYHTLKEQLHKNAVTGEEEQFYLPPDDKTVDLPYSFDKITPDGFPRLGTHVTAGDVVISKYMPSRGGAIRDTSVVLRTNEGGTVDRIIAGGPGNETVNGVGYSFCKLRLRDARTPEIGDKFSSRSGQKGTVGMLVPAHEMPFTADGLVPDLVVNPHAIPSRMTVGQLLEAVLGKACCATGERGNATPFCGTDPDQVAAALAAQGMDMHGDEIMYDPRTGRQMDVAVFIAPTYYQRLKHCVVDKCHSRGSTGPMIMLTRQPAEGRARDGGLRVGEMEQECLIAHATIAFMKERFMDCSDKFTMHTCGECGAIGVVNAERRQASCPACPNTTNFHHVAIPFAMKLLMQEVESMGVGTSLMAAGPHSRLGRSPVAV